jgi:hypothetical protein
VRKLKVAHGYSRIMQILNGVVPTVHTLAILSADNPQAKPLTPEENNKREERLRKMLKDSLLGFIQHKGKYGNFEKPFLIMNVQEELIKKLASKEYFDQESYIFGKVFPREQKVVFSLVEHGVTKSQRITVNRGEADREDFYSEYKGRKFYIPFFDEEHEGEVENSNLRDASHISFLRDEIPGGFEKSLEDLEQRSLKVARDIVGEYVGISLMSLRGTILKECNEIRKSLEKKDA